jgi:hypothetical protein
MRCDVFFKRETAISTALAIITILVDFQHLFISKNEFCSGYADRH